MAKYTTDTAMKSVSQYSFSSLVIAFSTGAWLLLFIWSNSSYQHMLNHGDWRQALPVHSHEDMASSLLAGGAGWILMIVAMMFPAMIPALQRMVSRVRLSLLLLGYLSAWLLFGAVAHLIGMFIQHAVGTSALLAGNGWLVSVAVLVLAGLYQLSNYKKVCLRRCEQYCATESLTRQDLHKTWVAGWRYALSCISCCWAVMLLMFVAWPGSVLWMLVLCVLMTVERFFSFELLRAPLSLLYLLSAVAVFVTGSM